MRSSFVIINIQIQHVNNQTDPWPHADICSGLENKPQPTVLPSVGGDMDSLTHRGVGAAVSLPPTPPPRQLGEERTVALSANKQEPLAFSCSTSLFKSRRPMSGLAAELSGNTESPAAVSPHREIRRSFKRLVTLNRILFFFSVEAAAAVRCDGYLTFSRMKEIKRQKH